MIGTVWAEQGQSWYAEAAAAGMAHPRLTFDLDVDVCVIGAGLAGLTVAREVARRGWSVAVLEAKAIAWNASGRNCGFVLPGFAADNEDIVARVGLDHAKALWQLSEMGAEYVRRTIVETGMPDATPVSGWLDVSKTDNRTRFAAQVALLEALGAEIEAWSIERVRAALKSDCYFHAVHFPKAFAINPLSYARGLARAAQAAGARIFEQTPALSIDPFGARKRIETPGGQVRAGHLVLAGSAYLGALSASLAETVQPVWTYVAVTAPLGERLSGAIAYEGAVSDTPYADHHYRIVDGERLLWCGGVSVWPRDPHHIVPRFKAAIARTYPQLGNVEITHVWSGLMAFSLHRMPQIGEVLPGVWLASAFGGHGLNTTAMAGELVARAIVEGDDRWRLFLPYELVWAGGRLGRAVLQTRYWIRRAAEDMITRWTRRQRGGRTRKGTPPSAPLAPGHKGQAFE